MADEVKAADDGGLGAAALAGDLGGTEQVDTIKPEDFGDGGRGPAAAGIELLQEREGSEGGAWVMSVWRLGFDFGLFFNHGKTLSPSGPPGFLVERTSY